MEVHLLSPKRGGAAGTLITPFIIFKLCKPEISETPEAPKEARRRLAAKGPMSRDEYIMLGTMLLAVSLWVSWLDRR